MDWFSAGFKSVLSFPSLPFWQGVQTRPGVFQQYPFKLGFDKPGPIRQVTDGEVISCVIDGYQSEDYGFMTAPPGASAWADSLGNMYIDAIVDACRDKKPQRILEVGAGSLYVARRVADYFDAIEYLAVDPSIHEIPPPGPIKVIADYFPCGNLEKRAYDAVIALNCLEHVPDPLAFCRAMREHMAENGVAVLVFPDCEGALAHGDLNVLVHEHLTYFTAASVRWLAMMAEFRLLSIRSINDTFIVVLEKRTGVDDGDARDAISSEPRLLELAAAIFDKVVVGKASLVKQAVAAGRKVGFHGATNGLNIFMHLLGTEIAGQCHVFDGDDSKAGLYLPACGRPILPSSDSSYAECNLMIISAMSYFDQIRRFALDRHSMAPEKLIALAA